jgi:hypothetical protein
MPELNDRDLRILGHASRYRLTTQEFLHRLYFADTQINAVTKVTSRLTEGGWLNRFELPRGRSYFVPGGRAVEAFQLSRHVARGFSEETLPTAYGVLADCAGTGNVRLTEADFRTYMPRLAVRGLMHSPHAIDKTQPKNRLALLLVDRDNPPERLLIKAGKKIKQRLVHDAYRELILRDEFSVRIVTATTEKRAAIERVVARREDRSVPILVAVAPELSHVWPERIGRGRTDAPAARGNPGHV